jgi:hypothetical protein
VRLREDLEVSMDLTACLAIVNAVAGADPGTARSPSPEEIDALLELTGAVAHASERKAAPLAAYAIGVAFGGIDPARRVAIMRAASSRIDAVGGTSPADFPKV